MKLRNLIIDDAPYMLEWMHDPDIVEYMRVNFAEKSIDDCLEFIKYAALSKDNIHLAVVNDNDEYMGTVSLKHIHNGAAEFAIIMRKDAIGKGYAKFAMDEIIRKGFAEYGLKYIYWNVMPDNKRAVRFYDKNGYQKTSWETIETLCEKKIYDIQQRKNLHWYLCKIPESR